MSVEEKETCNMHTKEKEKSGTCCQVKNEEEKSEYLNELIIFIACITICIKRLLGRQKMYLYTRWNETHILCMVL